MTNKQQIELIGYVINPYELAVEIDQMEEDIDHYEYANNVTDSEENIEELVKVLRTIEGTQEIIKFFKDTYKKEFDEIDYAYISQINFVFEIVNMIFRLQDWKEVLEHDK